jgi:hypothetical protein
LISKLWNHKWQPLGSLHSPVPHKIWALKNSTLQPLKKHIRK